MSDTKVLTKDKRNEIIISGASIITGIVTKAAVEKGWKLLFKEESPSKGEVESIDLKKILLWTAVSGTIISSAKLMATHFLSEKL